MKLGELNGLVMAMQGLTPDERVKWQQVLKGLDARLVEQAGDIRWAIETIGEQAELVVTLIEIIEAMGLALLDLDSRVTALEGS